MKRINVIIPILALILSITITGCSSGTEQAEAAASPTLTATPTPKPTPTPTPTPAPTPEPTPDLTGLAINPLTGLYVDEEIAARRPFAVVINNLNKALPQSGISQADIMYEVLAEGGITRMIAVFKDFDAEKIGPVRSTRHYFLDFALDNDAVFAHHGGSPQGYSNISSLKINNLDGMNLEGRFFFRDQQRKNTPGMYEHSSYTSAEKLLQAVENAGYRSELRETYENPFDFFEEDETLQGEAALSITVPYSAGSQVGFFEYDEETGTYFRSQNGNKHIDELTGEQLCVNNVLVQYASMYVIAGDDAGRREVKLISSGKGVLFTKGVSMPVNWAKASHDSPTVWTDENGEKVKLTQGKTWICVFSDSGEVIINNE